MAAAANVINVGSRKSELAMIQTNGVVAALQAKFPELSFEIHTMETLGDKVLDRALSKVGEKSLFTKELEDKLADGSVDLVVHSLKDLPTTLPPKLVIGAMCEREDPRDAVIFHPRFPQGTQLKDLPDGSWIGTSSLRRSAQLVAAFPKLNFESVRGNLNTRLRKLEESTADGAEGHRYSALVLAAAGVIRMGWKEKIGQYLDASICQHAVGQGSVAIETREGDERILKIVGSIQHDDTAKKCTAERAFMRRLEGGCSVPLGVHTALAGSALTIRGLVSSLDGKTRIEAEVTADAPDMAAAEAAGYALAEKMKAQGAVELLASIPRENTLAKPAAK